MPRTDVSQVGAVIELDDSIGVTPFINAANELVTEVCAVKTNPDGSPYYSDNRLAMIETWLAAHFYAQRDPRMSSVSPSGVSVRYQSQVDLGFNNTHYGQQALRLDTKGGLAALEARVKKGGGKLGVFWLGTDTLRSIERERLIEAEIDEDQL